MTLTFIIAFINMRKEINYERSLIYDELMSVLCNIKEANYDEVVSCLKYEMNQMCIDVII